MPIGLPFASIRNLIALVVVILLLVGFHTEGEAKRKKRRYVPPPLKILDITTSPMPFAPGKEPLTITVDVGLPQNLDGVDLLEVSSLISFPSKSSIRFLYNRLPLEEFADSPHRTKITTTLLWDGKDHTNQLVRPGTYQYEVRAKLMSHKEGPPRTKIVSLRARGKFEVSPPETTRNSQPHLEHVPFVSDENPAEELGEESEDIEGEDPGVSNIDEGISQETPQEMSGSE